MTVLPGPTGCGAFTEPSESKINTQFPVVKWLALATTNGIGCLPELSIRCCCGCWHAFRDGLSQNPTQGFFVQPDPTLDEPEQFSGGNEPTCSIFSQLGLIFA